MLFYFLDGVFGVVLGSLVSSLLESSSFWFIIFKSESS